MSINFWKKQQQELIKQKKSKCYTKDLKETYDEKRKLWSPQQSWGLETPVAMKDEGGRACWENRRDC